MRFCFGCGTAAADDVDEPSAEPSAITRLSLANRLSFYKNSFKQSAAVTKRKQHVKSRDGSTAVELLNKAISLKLGTLQHAIERMLIKWNREGGLPLLGDPNNPLYKLRVLKSGPGVSNGSSRDGGHLDPGDIIDKLDLNVTWFKLVDGNGLDAPADASSSKPPPPPDFRSTEADVLVFEVEADLVLAMHQDKNIHLQIHGNQWYTPTLGAVTIKHCKLGCRLRLWFSANANRLSIAFLKEPTVDWDIALALLVVNIPMPKGAKVEDDWLAKSLRKALAGLDVLTPAELDLSQPPPQAGEAIMKDLGTAYMEQAEQERRESLQSSARSPRGSTDGGTDSSLPGRGAPPKPPDRRRYTAPARATRTPVTVVQVEVDGV